MRPAREHPRIAADFPVCVHVGNRQFEIQAKNLSMAGLYLDGSRPLPELPPRFRLRLCLPGVEREVHTTCRVERRERSGVALSFASMDWDDLLLMARYLSPRL